MKKNLYHYIECGLTNVYLENGYKVDKDGVLYIDHVDNLHISIGIALITKQRKLSGREIRFIRHMMDLSQKSFGKLLGSDYQTILRWETGKNKITRTAEKLLRILFLEFLDPTSRGRELIDRLSDIDHERETNLMMKLDRGWKEVA
jgi:putative transcriptional regulator